MTRDEINDTCNQGNERMFHEDCFNNIEYIDNDPETETEREEYCEDLNLIDRNNNSSEDYTIPVDCDQNVENASNLRDYSRGFGGRFETKEKKSIEGSVPGASSYAMMNHRSTSGMASRIPVFDNSRRDVLVPTVYEENERLDDYDSNSDLYSDEESLSSGDETEEENFTESPPTCTSRHTKIYNYNKNSNNNKKKSLIHETDNGTNIRSVNFRLSQEQRRRNQPKTRVRSVQLSSMRSMPTSKTKKTRSWISRKVEYGQRLVEKNGNSNVQVTDFDRVDLFNRYFHDIFTTLLDSSWSMVLTLTAGVYVGHWIIFGFIYWLFAIFHGDYDRIIPAINASGSAFTWGKNATDFIDNQENNPCVFNVYDFKTALLFSLESETTIGYGTRTITTECPEAVICLTIQCIVSAIFDTWIIGLCFARLARPDARTKTTMFSEKAVICKRDGKRCLLVRFSNLRKSLLLNVSVRARLISLRFTQSKDKLEGRHGMLEQRQVTFENASSALLTAPIEYRHIIDEDSPFYKIKPDMFNSPDGQNYFELIFIVTGTLEPTGLTMHAQTSYLSSEILYGHRFVPVVSKSHKHDRWVVDFAHFHKTTPEPSIVHKKKINHNSAVVARMRDVSSPLVEETEDEIISANDDVFASDTVLAPYAAAESVV